MSNRITEQPPPLSRTRPASPSRVEAGAGSDLKARARAYRALAAVYDRDPAQRLYLDQVRRDTDAAHRWLNHNTEDKNG